MPFTIAETSVKF